MYLSLYSLILLLKLILSLPYFLDNAAHHTVYRNFLHHAKDQSLQALCDSAG